MPYRSRISRSNRPAGNDRCGQAGHARVARGHDARAARRGGPGGRPVNRYTTRSRVARRRARRPARAGTRCAQQVLGRRQRGGGRRTVDGRVRQRWQLVGVIGHALPRCRRPRCSRSVSGPGGDPERAPSSDADQQRRGGAVAGTVIGGASGRSGAAPSSIGWCADQRGERDSDQHQRRGERPASPRGEPARAMPSSLANRLNGGRPSRAIRPDGEGAPTSRARRPEPRTSAMAVVPCAAAAARRRQEQHGLGQAVAEHVQQHGGDRERLPTAAPRAIRPMCSMRSRPASVCSRAGRSTSTRRPAGWPARATSSRCAGNRAERRRRRWA